MHFSGRAAFHCECGLRHARSFYPCLPGREENKERTAHPIKAAGTAAFCRVFSIVQEKYRPYRGAVPEGFPAGGAGGAAGEAGTK